MARYSKPKYREIARNKAMGMSDVAAVSLALGKSKESVGGYAYKVVKNETVQEYLEELMEEFHKTALVDKGKLEYSLINRIWPPEDEAKLKDSDWLNYAKFLADLNGMMPKTKIDKQNADTKTATALTNFANSQHEKNNGKG